MRTAEAAPAEILIVDDTPANLDVLAGILRNSGYVARPVPSGPVALATARLRAPDLVLLDITMPGMDGFEVCRQLKEDPALADIPVIFVSAVVETLDKVRAFSLGAVDYIIKPYQVDEVRARVHTHLRLRRQERELRQFNASLNAMVQEQLGEIAQARLSTIIAMSKIAEYRDDTTGRHIERVCLCCSALTARLAPRPEYAEFLTDHQADDICYASPLHDIGKVGVPDAILGKPGRLTPEEFEVMKRHTVIGWSALAEVLERYPGNSFIARGAEIARSHHERWDGSGYPDGLAGNAIPLSARIVAVADVYDALRSERPYKRAFGHEEACEIVRQGSGAHFDPAVIEAFEEAERDLDAAHEA